VGRDYRDFRAFVADLEATAARSNKISSNLSRSLQLNQRGEVNRIGGPKLLYGKLHLRSQPHRLLFGKNCSLFAPADIFYMNGRVG